MMSFAWVNSKELVLLEAFSEVIMIDTTEKTKRISIVRGISRSNYDRYYRKNKQWKRSLLTARGKDSNGNKFIFLRVLCLISSLGCFGGY